jgi:hypothetical protein
MTERSAQHVDGEDGRPTREQLDAMLRESLMSGEPVPVNDAFWKQLRQRSIARAAAMRLAEARRQNKAV